MTRPAVSVVMPVYNAGKYVAQAIESILTQTFHDFEFLITDDGSTDGTAGILSQFAERDARIRVFSQENKGLVTALNDSCRIAGGTYVARMDADDISLPTRLEKQYLFLEAHPETGVLGTWIQNMDEAGDSGPTWPVPAEPQVVRWFLMFGNCVAHPTVMMRRSVIENLGFYRADAAHNEDYDLWIRAGDVTSVANLPEVLLKYRVSRSSISSRHLSVQEDHARTLKANLVSRVLRHPVSADAIEALRTSVEGLPLSKPQIADEAAGLVSELFQTLSRERPLTANVRSEVALDVVRRFWFLAYSVRKTSWRKAAALWMRSFAWLPSILTFKTIKKSAALLIWFARYRSLSLDSQRRVP